MRVLLSVFLLVGIAIGYLLPGNVSSLMEKPSEKRLEAGIFDIPKRFGQLELQSDYFKYTVLAEIPTGSIELIRLDDSIPKHMHPKENHFVYVYRGRARGIIGDATQEVVQGQMVAIPAGVPHSFERIGDAPVEIILFSSPAFAPADTVFLER